MDTSSWGALMLRSEKKELRRGIREFIKQNPDKLDRPCRFPDSDRSKDLWSVTNIGTDEKPKYVWRVCKKEKWCRDL